MPYHGVFTLCVSSLLFLLTSRPSPQVLIARTVPPAQVDTHEIAHLAEGDGIVFGPPLDFGVEMQSERGGSVNMISFLMRARSKLK
jgi:hypothetical protein